MILMSANVLGSVLGIQAAQKLGEQEVGGGCSRQHGRYERGYVDANHWKQIDLWSWMKHMRIW